MTAGRFRNLRRPAALVALVLAALLASCGRAETPKPIPPPAPQTRGTLKVPGLSGPVTVARDEWGVPHIEAATLDDLFFAQGFVQAQDRLFQMDLWKRAAQGRLAEVLGANFIQRDSMTRRIQFRGDYEREWASYAPDAHRIAVAFTNGINAWVGIARSDVPEEFKVAGWLPEPWKPEDLLNRTDAFLASGNALDDLFRARMIAALGVARVDQLLPPPTGRTVTDLGVDLSAITFVVSDAVRRIGTPPFFTTLTNPVSEAPRPSQTTGGTDVPLAPGNTVASPAPAGRETRLQPGRIGSGATWLVGPARTSTGRPLLATAEFNRFDTPARRYLVHLQAPGINVIGATAPWLPGVAIGHNDRIAWSYTPTDDDTQDVFVERVNPENAHQVARDGRWVDIGVDRERIAVLGREKPAEYERLYTPDGVVIAQDRERHLVYTLRWSGTELGGAGELAALSLMRASNWDEFTTALGRWKAPAAEFFYADVDGRVAQRRAGLIPIRADGRGSLPAAGWLSSRSWLGFHDAATTTESAPSSGDVLVASAAGGPQTARIREAISSSQGRTPESLARLQTDVWSSNASKLIEALSRVEAVPQKLVQVRRRLLDWDQQMHGTSTAAALYVAWEGAVRQRLAARLVSSELVEEFAARLDPIATLEGPVSRGAGGDIGPWRDILLVDALADAADQVRPPPGPPGEGGGAAVRVILSHPLGVFALGQKRFDVGPYPLDGHTDTVFTTDGRRGPVFRLIQNPADWNGTLVVNAPGQSGSPSSLHYDDFAARWAAGSMVNLVFARERLPQDKVQVLRLEPK
ncbi:MAG: penicillin acylase family protein [Acidobacteria bacterium]|nr:penicillin acylase family protein [Acidobacteriota bacterium]